MKTPTYNDQFQKITKAYFKDELEPYNNCACFIGNLLNNTNQWGNQRNLYYSMRDFLSSSCARNPSAKDPIYRFYTMEEICAMEENFLNTFQGAHGHGWKTEESLFSAMDSTLDMLRKIHESKGEVIEHFEFKKRELVTV